MDEPAGTQTRLRLLGVRSNLGREPYEVKGLTWECL